MKINEEPVNLLSIKRKVKLTWMFPEGPAWTVSEL